MAPTVAGKERESNVARLLGSGMLINYRTHIYVLLLVC